MSKVKEELVSYFIRKAEQPFCDRCEQEFDIRKAIRMSVSFDDETYCVKFLCSEKCVKEEKLVLLQQTLEGDKGDAYFDGQEEE